MADIKNTQYQTITINKISLTDDDFERLKNGGWLNCKLLEAYFFLVGQECSKNGVQVKMLTSHFWSQFMTNGYQAIKSWITKEDILTYDVIFTLINTGVHWTLMYMNIPKKTLWHLDPLTGIPAENTIADFKTLCECIRGDQRTGLPFIWKDWDLNPEKLPLQKNNVDCGVLICHYALHLMDIRSKDIVLTRQEMISELTNKSIRQLAKAPSNKTQTSLLKYFKAPKKPPKDPKLGTSKEDTHAGSRNIMVIHPMHGMSTSRDRDSGDTKDAAVPILIPGMVHHTQKGETVKIEDTGVPGVTSDTDESNEGFEDSSNTPHPLATPKEKYLWGLLKKKEYSRSNVIVKEVEGRGRSAFAAREFRAGDFICDYRGVVRKKVGKDWGDERNASLGLGCYCLDAVYDNETYVFDATASINDPGRYINHARKNCNIALMQPVKIGEPPKSQLKIGFVALRNIHAGEELFYNYGIRDPDIPWLATDAKKVATTLPQVTTVEMPSTAKSRPRPPAKRVRRSCPIPGCLTTNVLKLADHIRVKHPQYSQAERHVWLQKARKPTTLGRIDRHLQRRKYQETHPTPPLTVTKSAGTPGLSSMSTNVLNFEPPPSVSESAETPGPSSMSINEFNFEDFKTYLKVTHNKNEETAQATLRDVQMYLNETRSKQPDQMKLIDINKLEKFVEAMTVKKEYKPTTRAEKLRRIKLAIKFMIRQKDDQDLYYKGKRTIDELDEWCHGLGKKIAIQRQEYALVMRKTLPQIMDPNEFLEHDLVKEKLSRAFNEVQGGNFSKEYVDTVTAYAAAIILYGNGQRSGVISNLTISEFELREEEENDKVVIPCVHHKTASQGMAQLVITTATEEVLLYYHEKIRIKLLPSEEHKDKFFLTFNSGIYTQVYRKLREGLSIGKIHPPVPSKYRVLVSSEARRYLVDHDRSNVVKHLSHSMRTSELYYEQMNTKDATDAHRTIHNLSMKRKWSKTEITQLKDRWPLSGSPPPLKECKQHAEQFGMARTPKELYHKWHQLNSQL